MDLLEKLGAIKTDFVLTSNGKILNVESQILIKRPTKKGSNYELNNFHLEFILKQDEIEPNPYREFGYIMFFYENADLKEKYIGFKLDAEKKDSFEYNYYSQFNKITNTDNNNKIHREFESEIQTNFIQTKGDYDYDEVNKLVRKSVEEFYAPHKKIAYSFNLYDIPFIILEKTKIIDIIIYR